MEIIPYQETENLLRSRRAAPQVIPDWGYARTFGLGLSRPFSGDTLNRQYRLDATPESFAPEIAIQIPVS